MNTPSPGGWNDGYPERAAAAGHAGGRGQCHAIGTNDGPVNHTRSARTGCSSTTKPRLAPVSARSGGLDKIGGGPECGVYIQMRGIEQVRVRRGLEWGGGALGVAL